jgi:ring-1,2-phenylacetyl-CoA epoxidase subunit PaaE
MTTSLLIDSIVQETSDTKSFVLKSSGNPISYQPGQFLTLLHPLSSSIRRSYSLSSHPVLDQHLQITVKRIANGEFSRWLFDRAMIGDHLQTIGASGFFTLPDDLSNNTTLFFLAAGSGITPVFSLLKEVLFQRKQQVVLVYSSRSEIETIFYRELRTLEKKFPERLSIVFLFSGDKNLYRARLSKFLLTELIHQHVSGKTKTLVYLCGPHDYMQMARITLLTEGIPLENIRTEKFNTDKPIIKELPPDTNQHQVSIEYQGRKFLLAVKYPSTILQTAKLQGIDLPYSCEAGRCGTCAATCLSGKIWMSRNEVLLDKEMKKGRVLTCTGYPVGGDVELIVSG